jgi:hypothetical protein
MEQDLMEKVMVTEAVMRLRNQGFIVDLSTGIVLWASKEAFEKGCPNENVVMMDSMLIYEHYGKPRPMTWGLGHW